jgi:hypothetical protein
VTNTPKDEASHAAAAASETRAQAKGLYRKGWRAFPFVKGALVQSHEVGTRAHVGDDVCHALREVELDTLIPPRDK